MKRVVSSLLAAAAVVVASGSAFAQDQMVWWTWNWDSAWQEETWSKKAKEFSDQTGIQVEIRTMPWNELGPGIRTASSADRVGDVVMVPHSDYLWLSRSALLSDVTGLVNDELDPGDFIPAIFEGMKVDGKIFGVPERRAGYALVYNEAILKQAGVDKVPETLDEVIAAAKQVTEKVEGVFGWGMPLMPTGNAYNRWENVFYAYGGSWLDETGKDVPANFLDAAAKAFQFHKDVAPYTPPSHLEDTNDDLVRFASQGLVALWQNTLSSVSTMKELTSAELLPSIKYAPFPAGAEGNLGVTSVNGWDVVIPAGAPNPEAGKKFLAFWTSSQNMGDTTMTLPSRKSSMSNPRITAYPEPFLGGKGKDTLSETWAGDVRGVVWEQLQGVVLDQVTPADAAQKVADAVKAGIAQSK